MKKIQFGAGCLPLPGWENHDLDVDIRKPLPYENSSVDAIFAEMVLEHVSAQEGWGFLDECWRILVPQGRVRLVIPDFQKIWKNKNKEWFRVNTGVTQCRPDWKDNMKSVLFAHGHQSLWSSKLLAAVMESIGFDPVHIQWPGISNYPEFQDIEQHWRSVGREVSESESGCVEGVALK